MCQREHEGPCGQNRASLLKEEVPYASRVDDQQGWRVPALLLDDSPGLRQAVAEAGLLAFCALVLGPYGGVLPQPYSGLLIPMALALIIVLAVGWLLQQLTPLILLLNEQRLRYRYLSELAQRYPPEHMPGQHVGD